MDGIQVTTLAISIAAAVLAIAAVIVAVRSRRG